MDARLAAARRKRLGQFFSGVRLGRLLAGLTNVTSVGSVIDPMVGCGDLLQACLDLGATPNLIVGMEVDEIAAKRAQHQLPAASIVTGDAFEPNTLRQLPTLAYDLVIGNPPFVRYQDGGDAQHGLPDATTVRANLAAAITLFENQGRSDASVFRPLVNQYSGLADLAVPACILSMLLVAPGGEIALVLPQSWLARDYASPVRYALDTMFNVIAVVEDETASWFKDAVVKTSLLVAQRPHLSASPRRIQPLPVHVRLGAQAANDRSLVGMLAPEATSPELAVGDMIRQGGGLLREPQHAQSISIRHFPGLIDLQPRRVAGLLEGDAGLPAELRDALGDEPSGLVTLERLGASTGQGLRTGANDFFYVEAKADLTTCRVARELGGAVIPDVHGLVRLAVRDQTELRTKKGAEWSSAILDLRSVALPDDLSRSNDLTRMAYRAMPARLAEHVRACATVKSGKAGRERPIPELSAVVTNVRPAKHGRAARFWYQLPDFQDRHAPHVYMPRVNAGRPKAYLNLDRAALVDANFVTFCCPPSLPPRALVALLNSAWAWAYLELVGAVMGGGALKIEGTMLRRMPLPNMAQEKWRRLAETKIPLDENHLCSDADRIFLEDTGNPELALRSLRHLAETRRMARSAQGNRKSS